MLQILAVCSVITGSSLIFTFYFCNSRWDDFSSRLTYFMPFADSELPFEKWPTAPADLGVRGDIMIRYILETHQMAIMEITDPRDGSRTRGALFRTTRNSVLGRKTRATCILLDHYNRF